MGEESAGSAVTCVVAQGDGVVIGSVSNLLAAHGVEVVASATDGSAALAAIEAHSPTVAIVDLHMRRLDGIEVARLAGRSRPGTATVLFCDQAEREQLAEALQAGIRGFVHRHAADQDELVRALTLTADGATYVDPHFAPTFLHAGAAHLTTHLTTRESEILRLLADGHTNHQIGEALHISPHTVRSHLRHAMHKLDADNRTQAVATALRHALID